MDRFTHVRAATQPPPGQAVASGRNLYLNWIVRRLMESNIRYIERMHSIKEVRRGKVCACSNRCGSLGLSRVSVFTNFSSGPTAFKSTPDITIIIITMRARVATAGNCAQRACTKTSWENRVKGTVNVIAGCAIITETAHP